MNNLNLHYILSNVKEYRKNFGEIYHLIPHPTCKDENCVLISWGVYLRRKVKKTSQDLPVEVLIKRYFCKVCQKTLSFLPPFLLPFKRYMAKVINESFKKWAQGEKIPRLCGQFQIYEESTLEKWFYPVEKNMRYIKEKGYKYLCQKVFHLKQGELFKEKENLKGVGKRGKVWELFVFLKNLSSILESLGFIKRTPYHYALIFKPP